MKKKFVFIFLLIKIFSVNFLHATHSNDLQKIMRETIGVSNLSLQINLQEALKQQVRYSGRVEWQNAFVSALNSMVNDGRDLESPLANAKLLAKIEEPCKNLNEEACLKYFLEQPGSQLVLLSDEDLKARTKNFPPERGETLEKNWLFFLKIKTLSDHLYWIIVPRVNSEKTYNYGFN